jgi:hypothetical protein
MEDMISAGNRIPGLVVPPIRIVLSFPGFAETITLAAKPALEHSIPPAN